jgi:hypothetical protein
VRTQALDNASGDQCVLDGILLDATAPEAAAAMQLLSETRRHGQTTTEGTTEITNGAGIAVKVRTSDVDSAGRHAPVMAVFDRSRLNDFDAVMTDLVQYTEMLGRTIDQEALTADLTRWRGSGKATGGRLSRLRRRIYRVARRKWAALARRLRALLGGD